MTRSAADLDEQTHWREFLAADTVLATRDGDYPTWRRGRDRYAAWVIPINEPAGEKRLGAVRRALRGRLIHAGPRAPHVTLFAWGSPQMRPGHDRGIAPSLAQRHAAAAGA